jgi:hypothetical protein
MANDFLNFILIYLVLVLMFTIVANLMFLFYCPEFATLFDSLITLIDSSMGNYSFSVFD